MDPWSGKIPHASRLLSPVPQRSSLCSRAWEPRLLKPLRPEPVPRTERSAAGRGFRTTAGEEPPVPAARESLHTATKSPGCQIEINKCFSRVWDRHRFSHLSDSRRQKLRKQMCLELLCRADGEEICSRFPGAATAAVAARELLGSQ